MPSSHRLWRPTYPQVKGKVNAITLWQNPARPEIDKTSTHLERNTRLKKRRCLKTVQQKRRTGPLPNTIKSKYIADCVFFSNFNCFFFACTYKLIRWCEYLMGIPCRRGVEGVTVVPLVWWPNHRSSKTTTLRFSCGKTIHGLDGLNRNKIMMSFSDQKTFLNVWALFFTCRCFPFSRKEQHPATTNMKL